MIRNVSKATLFAIGAYAVLTVIETHPALWVAATHQLSCCNDAWLFIWTIGWDVHALTTAPWAIFDANIFYPHHNTLAYSEHLIGSALLAAPVIWLTGNTLLATNLVAIGSAFLCAVGGYFLGRRLGLSPAAAFLCGLVFGFTPPRLLRIYQMHQTTIQWIPFALGFLHTYFKSNRPRDLRLAAAFFSLQAITSGHGAAMLTLGGAVVILCHFLSGAPLALVKRVKDVGVSGLLLFAPMVLIFIPYWRARREVGLVRKLDDQGVTASSWLSSPSHIDAFLMSLLPDWGWLRVDPDVHLFPGFLPLLLAATAFLIPLAARERAPVHEKRSWRIAAAALTLLTLSQLVVGLFVVFDGPVRWRMGNTVVFTASGIKPWIYAAVFAIARAALGRHVPFAPHVMPRRLWESRTRLEARGIYVTLLLLTAWMAIGPPYGIWPWIYQTPGLSFIRVPSRFMLLGMLALGVLAGIGFDRLAARASHRLRIALMAVLALLMSAEFLSLPLDLRPYTIEIPAIHRWLNTQPKPFSAASFPVPRTENKAIIARRTTIYMQYSMAHFQPIVHGYSGIEPPGYVELENKLMYFPDDASLSALADLNVTYAAVHLDRYRPHARAELDAGLERFVRDGWLRLVFEDVDRGRVYAIHRPEAAAPAGTGAE